MADDRECLQKSDATGEKSASKSSISAQIFDTTEHPHIRYNPLKGEWILVSPHRTKRPWKGQLEKPQEQNIPRWDASNPLCPRAVRASGAVRTQFYKLYFHVVEACIYYLLAWFGCWLLTIIPLHLNCLDILIKCFNISRFFCSDILIFVASTKIRQNIISKMKVRF